MSYVLAQLLLLVWFVICLSEGKLGIALLLLIPAFLLWAEEWTDQQNP